MNKLDEIIANMYLQKGGTQAVQRQHIKQVALEFAKHILEEAAENADAFINQNDDAYIEGNVWAEVDKESITDTLNKYL